MLCDPWDKQEHHAIRKRENTYTAVSEHGEDYGTRRIRGGHTLCSTSEFWIYTTTTLLITFCCCEWFCRRETTSRQRTSFCLKVKQKLYLRTETAQQPMVLPWYTVGPTRQSWSQVGLTLGPLQHLALSRYPTKGHRIAFLVLPPFQNYRAKLGGETNKEKSAYTGEGNGKTHVGWNI